VRTSVINSIGSSQSVSGVSFQSGSAASTVEATQPASDSTALSGLADLFSKLEALQQSDPSKLKEALAAIAKKLSEAAKSAATPEEKKALIDLADKFGQAAKTGDLASVEKAISGGPSGPGDVGGSGGGAAQTYDPADTNQDGTVSLQERLAYEAKAAAADSSTGLGAYRKILLAAADAKAGALFSSLSAVVDSVGKA